MKKFLLSALLLAPVLALALSPDPSTEARIAEARKVAGSLHYRTGSVLLGGGTARLSIRNGYKYLDAADSGTLLSKLWGNPPQPGILGSLMPDDFDPLVDSSWLVVITYADDGFVKDEDAGKIDYADLLAKMKEGAKEANKERAEKGYPSIEIVGWAEPPRYDGASHKLYWAKQVRFSSEKGDTLNYNFRILGRSGVLVLNAVASIDRLADVKRATPDILSMVDFEPGHRYADFNKGTDKVATYGIAALVAGGIAAKAGLLKGLWVAILALKKVIIVALLAAARYAKRGWEWFRGLFGRGKAKDPATPLEPPAGG